MDKIYCYYLFSFFFSFFLTKQDSIVVNIISGYLKFKEYVFTSLSPASPPPFNSSFYGWKDSKILFIVSRENSSPGRMTKCTFVFLLCTSQRHIDWSFLRCKFFASHFPIPFALSSPDIFTLPRVKLPRLSFLFQITGHSWISWWFYALSMYQILKLSIIWTL